jgi:hypothetical protein
VIKKKSNLRTELQMYAVCDTVSVSSRLTNRNNARLVDMPLFWSRILPTKPVNPTPGQCRDRHHRGHGHCLQKGAAPHPGGRPLLWPHQEDP